MRSLAVPVGLVAAALLIAGVWMSWVVGQGTGQLIESGWPAFRYGAALLVALLAAIAGLIALRASPSTHRRLRLAVGVIGNVEVILFGIVWFTLAVIPAPQ